MDQLAWDDGTGSSLYLAGAFSHVGAVAAQGIARFDGTEVHALPGHSLETVQALVPYDDGSGERLAALGRDVNGQSAVELWDGVAWTSLGTPGGSEVLEGVQLAGELYVAARYTQLTPQSRVMRWTGRAWASVGGAVFSRDVADLELFDDGSGMALYACGSFLQPVPYLTRWDGAAWQTVGGAPNFWVDALAVHDDGSGSALYAGGRFVTIGGLPLANIARWDGVQWSGAGTGYAGYHALESLDRGNGPELFASRIPFPPAASRWNGFSWESLGANQDNRVYSFGAFDSGTGPQLYAGGQFNHFLMRWSGSAWDVLTGGPGGNVNALEVFDAGQGPELYVGGKFTLVGGVPSPRLARWDGTSWGTVPVGAANEILALSAFDAGDGEALYSAQLSSSQFKALIQRWDGQSWSTAGVFHTGFSRDLEVFDDGNGTGPSLFAVGTFAQVDQRQSHGIARWETACPCPPVTYCTAKTNSAGCTPTIGAAGTYASASQPSGFHITSGNTLDGASGLFFYGYAPKASMFQGGWLCVQAPVKRTGLQNSGGLAPCGGSFSYDFNARIASGADPALVPGRTVFGQYWSRDPASSFNTNRTAGIQFTICP